MLKLRKTKQDLQTNYIPFNVSLQKIKINHETRMEKTRETILFSASKKTPGFAKKTGV